MKRQRAFLDQGSQPSKSRKVSIVPLQPKLNASQRIQVARMIKRDLEVKSIISGINLAAVASTPTFQKLTEIPVGTSDNSRIGNHVHLKRLNVRLSVFPADATNTFRLIFIRYMENDLYTGTPTGGQILANLSGGATDVLAPYNRETTEAYKVIKDVTISMTLTQNACITKVFSIPLRGKAQYVGATTDGIGKLYFMYLSDSTAITHPTMSWQTEVLYSDE